MAPWQVIGRRESVNKGHDMLRHPRGGPFDQFPHVDHAARPMARGHLSSASFAMVTVASYACRTDQPMWSVVLE